jgi:gliding motility-associated-like protein
MINKQLILIIFITIHYFSLSQNLEVELIKTDKECELGSAQVNVKNGTPPYSVLWSNSSTNTTISNLPIGDYNVVITDAALKDTTLYFKIDSISCLPNPSTHFTPNDDLYNDTWQISKLNYYPDFELSVYNRWGQLIHYQINDYIPWDGKNQGIQLPDATYFYIIFLSKIEKKRLIKGEVSILR